MTNYQKLNRFGKIISELVAFYRDLSAELPDLHFADALAPAYSEVKKCPTGYTI